MLKIAVTLQGVKLNSTGSGVFLILQSDGNLVLCVPVPSGPPLTLYCLLWCRGGSHLRINLRYKINSLVWSFLHGPKL